MQLRDYQTKAISDLRSSFKQGNKSPLLVMPTGSGKTVVFAQISKTLELNKKNVLILVHRKELVDQASNKLEYVDVFHGIIASGYKGKTNNIQVASVQTLVRRLESINYKPDYLIIDEAHHAAAGTWQKIINYYKDTFKIGCTATPERLDGKGLGDYFDDMVLGPDTATLIEQGYLAPYKVYAPPFKVNLDKIRTRVGDYSKTELVEEMSKTSIIGDAVEQYRKHADGLPAIAFCVSIKHAEDVKNKFLEAGYKAAIVHGEMKTTERDDAIKGLANGSVQVLTSVDVISEGTDVPIVAAAILLRPTQSLALYLQQVGRILRPQENKTAIILDHVNSTRTHGFVDDDREWDLNPITKHTRKGVKAVGVETCKQCFATYKPQPACPVCGYKAEPKERILVTEEGELELLNKEKEPQTLKNNYKDSIYAQKEFYSKVYNKFNSINRKSKILFETDQNWLTSNKFDTKQDKEVKIGDNIVFYEGMNKPRYGVVLGFIDKGYKIGHTYPYFVPALTDKHTEMGFNYAHPEIVKEGVNFGELNDIKRNNEIYNKIVFLGKRFQPYINLKHKEFIFATEKLYLRRLRRNDGKSHKGYKSILLTEKGIEQYDPSDKTGSNPLPTVNFKQALKVRQQIRDIKPDKFLVEKFIKICRDASFRVDYNADWIYRNVFAKKFIDTMQKKIELRQCKTIEEFEAVALKHGHKKGWGYYQWQFRNKKK